jgi:hypothetical protein
VRQKQSKGIERSSLQASGCPLRKVRAAFANTPLAANIPGFCRGRDQAVVFGSRSMRTARVSEQRQSKAILFARCFTEAGTACR